MTLLQLLRLCNLRRKNGLVMTVIWEWFEGSGCGLLKVILRYLLEKDHETCQSSSSVMLV
jgi:hypothetical protein